MSLFCLDLRRNSSPRKREAYTIEMTLNYKSWLVRKSILVPWLARQWNLSRFCQLQLTITFLLLIVTKVKKITKFEIFFWKILRSRWLRAKVPPKRFHLTGNTMRFHPDIQKLQHAEKVVLDSPGLVYFAIGLVNSLLNLFWGIQLLQKNCKQYWSSTFCQASWNDFSTDKRRERFRKR